MSGPRRDAASDADPAQQSDLMLVPRPRNERLPESVWSMMRADPEHAPEHLVLAAVRWLGPQAQEWVQVTRRRYPGIDSHTLASYAVRRFRTLARLSGATAGATGAPGAVIDFGVLAWTQARMVLHIAAAYGLDPTNRERAVELLVLQGMYDVVETARTAVAAARGREEAAALPAGGGGAQTGVSTAISTDGRGGPSTSAVLAQLTWKLATMAGLRAAKRFVAKLVPGASVILGTWANSAATSELGRRAVRLYRDKAACPG